MFKRIYFLVFVLFVLAGFTILLVYSHLQILVVASFILFIPVLLVYKSKRDKFVSFANVKQENLQEKINLDGEKVDTLTSKISASEDYLEKLAFLESFQLNLSKVMDEEGVCRAFVDNLKQVYSDIDYILLYLINFREQVKFSSVNPSFAK